MEDIFRIVAGYIALGLEVIAVVVIAYGAIRAVINLVLGANPDPEKPLSGRKNAWVHLGVWLLIGLEFELGADIIRSAISPTWEQLGQLGAIAVIRTFLNYFLEKDVEKYAEGGESPSAPIVEKPA